MSCVPRRNTSSATPTALQAEGFEQRKQKIIQLIRTFYTLMQELCCRPGRTDCHQWGVLEGKPLVNPNLQALVGSYGLDGAVLESMDATRR